MAKLSDPLWDVYRVNHGVAQLRDTVHAEKAADAVRIYKAGTALLNTKGLRAVKHGANPPKPHGYFT